MRKVPGPTVRVKGERGRAQRGWGGGWEDGVEEEEDQINRRRGGREGKEKETEDQEGRGEEGEMIMTRRRGREGEEDEDKAEEAKVKSYRRRIPKTTATPKLGL